MDLNVSIKRALISVSDKTGVVELAKALVEQGCEIISTGGTRRKLTEAGISTIEISEVTGNPEAFGGRMKTISFNIESALLFDRQKDKAEAEALNIQAIDLVVCNLYPFKKVLEQGADFDTLIENIDIGGPTMIRAAAKNFKYVTTLTQPEDYSIFIQALKEHKGVLPYNLRKEFMVKAFNHTADYDALIAMTMDEEVGKASLRMSFTQGKVLRYGENSHQKARFYRDQAVENSLYDLNILHGKTLSFNNILDIQGAIESVKDLEQSACTVIKHSNPCGICQGENQAEALKKAWEGDPISAFGSIIAFNQPLTLDTVQFFQLDAENRSQRKFVEVVIAPQIESDALTYLQQHKNLRIIEFDPKSVGHQMDYRYMNGALLVQDPDNVLYEKMEWSTEATRDLSQFKPLVEFGIKGMKNIKSNSIAIVREKDGYCQLLGMGAGQPNRLVATSLAIQKCRENLHNEFKGEEADFEAYVERELGAAVLISDAFFPFADNVEIAAAAGVKTIVQPGGSIRDKQVIQVCNSLNLAMLMIGTRHFKH